ncbi:hypothetical protein MWH28_08875 [Natroniella sulfidigena]|uniref:hypothetical protein n=1 Tax=Natroniella sulfidigena TaxID=723921 RepID=UPI00200B154A|nr:hypothetical protein [Natroniella sulfidigena]MCK8817467.1 hypothetical protein [Natroniella sulfidigena]
MFCKLAVVGLGDVRKKDKGVTIHLVEKLKNTFSEKLDVLFINAGETGEDLFEILQTIKAEKILVLDTMRELVKPGELDYLKIKPKDPTNLKELLMLTIGIDNDGWGSELSEIISAKFYDILDKISNVIFKLLG